MPLPRLQRGGGAGGGAGGGSGDGDTTMGATTRVVRRSGKVRWTAAVTATRVLGRKALVAYADVSDAEAVEAMVQRRCR